jgi:hypothetical protein
LAAGIGLAWALTLLAPVHLHAPGAVPAAVDEVQLLRQ